MLIQAKVNTKSETQLFPWKINVSQRAKQLKLTQNQHELTFKILIFPGETHHHHNHDHKHYHHHPQKHHHTALAQL